MPTPPPIPTPAPSGRVGYVIAAIVAVSLAAVVGLVALGVVGVRKARARVAERTAAMAEFRKSVEASRGKAVDSLKSHDPKDSIDAVGGMQEALKKSAAQMGGRQGAEMRGMAEMARRLQIPMVAYGETTARMKEAEVWNFRIRDDATLRTNRQLFVEFLERNARLGAAVERRGTIAREALAMEGVPAARIDAIVADIDSGLVPIRDLQVQIRAADKTMGESAIEMLDLLEHNAGKWRFDETTGKLRFNERAQLQSFQTLAGVIKAAGARQLKAQEELARIMQSRPKP